MKKRKKEKLKIRRVEKSSLFSSLKKNHRYNADGAFAASVLLCLMALGTLYVKDKLERKAVE